MAVDTDSRLLALFRSQAGVITRAQVSALGVTDRQISYRLGTGLWVAVRRGVYRHVLFDESEAMRVHALTLGGRAFVSHRHAAKLHGLDPVLMRCPEVTSSRRIHDSFEGVIIHQTTQFRRNDIVWNDGLPVSTVERTIMDCAAVEPQLWKTMALIDSAREAGLTDLTKLHGCLETHARRGRDGTVRFRRALSLIAANELPAASPFSRQVAESIHAAGLPYPYIEEEIRSSDGRRLARVDLSFDEAVLIFLDGFAYHGRRRAQTNRDRQQRQVLRSAGYVVLEFTWDQWRRDPAFVVRQTMLALSRRPVRPNSRAA